MFCNLSRASRSFCTFSKQFQNNIHTFMSRETYFSPLPETIHVISVHDKIYQSKVLLERTQVEFMMRRHDGTMKKKCPPLLTVLVKKSMIFSGSRFSWKASNVPSRLYNLVMQCAALSDDARHFECGIWCVLTIVLTWQGGEVAL